MFEISKFKKRFPLLTQFITDKNKMKKILNDEQILDFYQKENTLLEQFINNLKLIYSEEKTRNIIIDFISNKKFTKLQLVSYNLNQCINWTKHYHNNLEPIKDIEWSIIENNNQKYYGYDIERIVLNLCFIYNYKNNITINNYDIKDIFLKTDSLITKRTLYSLLKNNNLTFFAFIINELTKYNIHIENIDNLFKEEINDKLYNKEIKDNLSEEDFLKLIIYYFNNASRSDKKIISKLLETKNYTLISDILHLKGEYKFSRSIEEDEVSKDIFSLINIDSYQISSIIYDILSPREKLDIEYLYGLKSSIEYNKYEEFYAKHIEVLDLLTSIDTYDSKKYNLEQQKSIYKYVKSLTKKQKDLIIEEIKNINLEIRNLFREEYLEVFKKSNNIFNKSETKIIKDSQEKEHTLKVYELKDEEPFTFLITVMHEKARDNNLNMYNRPAHKLTINDPSNFCKDLEGGSEIISTSMINDRFIDTFVGPYANVMYIFANLNSDDILSVCHEDAAFPPVIDENMDLFSKNKPVGPEELMIETMHNRDYNEIAIRRKRKDNTRIMPSAILCFDKINDESIKHAKYFNIPIIVIKTKTYKYLNNYTTSLENNRRYR